jgi:hypothetical protein
LWKDRPVPDRRTRRGPHPKDAECFSAAELPRLRQAVDDLSLLLTRGYSPKAALKLVGDRHNLRDRQRKALQRSAAGDAECATRRERRLAPTELAGETVVVDGYNVLLSVEAALCDGVLLVGRDGTIRDLAAMSGHYRRVHATLSAVDLLAGFFAAHRCARVQWLLDRPVSNSGRLRGLIEEAVEGRSPAWTVELTDRTDRVLIDSPHVVASADSAVLDRCGRWVNLVWELVSRSIPEAWIVDLSGEA